MNRISRVFATIVTIGLILASSISATWAADEPQPANLISQFRDVASDNPNLLFIEYLANRGFVKGFPDGTYRPKEGLTRAEAAAMLVKVSGLETGTGVTRFKDVPASHWAAGEISAVEAAGLFKGYPDGTFRPNAKLTRAEGIVLVMKLAKQPDPGTPLPAIDDVKINHWAARPIAIGLAAEMLSLTSDGKKFLPNELFTRGALARAIGVLLTSDPDWYKQDLPAQLKVTKGTSTLVRNGYPKQSISSAAQLLPGDVIQVGPDSSAEIDFPDGSGLKLEADTELVFHESLGRSFIKEDGTPGTGLEWLTVKVNRGTLYGALATNNPEGEEAGAEDETAVNNEMPSGTVTTASLADWWNELFKKNDVKDQGTAAQKEWYKVAKSKRTKVKVDMPWGVAAVRGTEWMIRVVTTLPAGEGQEAQVASVSTVVLRGELTIEKGEQTVTVTDVKKVELTDPEASLENVVTITQEELKKEFQAAITWLIQQSDVMDKNKEAEIKTATPAEEELPPAPKSQPTTEGTPTNFGDTPVNAGSTQTNNDTGPASFQTSFKELILVALGLPPDTTVYVETGELETDTGGNTGTTPPADSVTNTLPSSGGTNTSDDSGYEEDYTPAAAPTPTFNPAAGYVAFGTEIQIISLGADAIYYTTDGSTPAAAAGGSTQVYNDSDRPVISTAMTIKAVAVKTGAPNSEVGTASYYQASSANLTGLTLSGAPANYAFAPGTYDYSGVTVANSVASITVIPTGSGTIIVDGTEVASGTTSGGIALSAGVEKTILVTVTEEGKTVKTYTIKVTREQAEGAQLQNLAAGPTQVVLYFSEPLTGSGLTSSDFSVTVAGTPRAVTCPAGFSGKTLVLTLDGAALLNGQEIGVALTESGAAKIQNSSGNQLIAGTTGTIVFRTTQIGVASNHTAALKSDGTVWTWGNNSDGQLGNGQPGISSTIPTQVLKGDSASSDAYLQGVQAISAGVAQSNTLALKDDGTVWKWGYFSSGNILTPTPVLAGEGVNLQDVTAIAAGGAHGLALKNDGTVWAWGQNYYGELGNGTTNYSIYPTQVSGLTNVIAIAAGFSHSMALKNDGTLWLWGNNEDGQLGDPGAGTKSSTPVKVMDDVISMAGGSGFSVAVKSDGTVWAWGRNYYSTFTGLLGTGSGANYVTAPAQVTAGVNDSLDGYLHGVETVAGGDSHILAVKKDRTVWAWGYNGSGALGYGANPSSSAPVQVLKGASSSGDDFLHDVVAVAAGNSTIALKEDGSLWAWGWNFTGMVGDGTTFTRYTPVRVTSLMRTLQPAANLSAGTYSGTQSVTLTAETDASIWYTTDGTDPKTSSTKLQYTIPIQITATTALKAYAVKSGMADSEVVTINYTISVNPNGTWAPVGIARDGGIKSSSFIQYNGQLYAGTYYGGGIWSWNGTAWNQIGGASNPLVSADVTSLTILNGSLFASTDYNGGGVWSWDGSNWTQVGGASNPLTSRSIYSLVSYNNSLYAGTNFGAGGVWVWDGTNWSQLGGTSNILSSEQISSIYFVDGTLYAATKGKGVWSWDGTNWTQVGGSSNPLAAEEISQVTFSNGTLYAGISYNGGGVWAWDGSNWSQVGGTNSPMVSKNITSLTIENGKLYAGTSWGGGGVWVWDETQWLQVNDSSNSFTASFIQKLFSENGNVFAATESGIWAWNGTSWSTVEKVGSLFGSDVRIINVTTINNVLYAITQNYKILQWDGTNWSVVGGDSNPCPLTYVSSLTTFGGYLTAAGDGVWTWNGENWTQVGALSTPLAAGTSLTVLNSRIYMGTSYNGVWIWDGSSWSPVGGAENPLASIGISSIMLVDSKVYAGTSTNGLWVWDGTNWSEVGGAANPIVSEQIDSLINVNDTIYVSTWINGVWAWDGSNWAIVGDQPQDLMDARLAFYDGLIYAAAANYVSAWDGTNWSQFLGGTSWLDNPVINSQISSVTIFDSNIYIGTIQKGVWSYSPAGHL